MQFFDSLGRYRPQALAVLRIMAALLFIEHGTMKLFGFPAPMGEGSLPPLILFAGILEVFGGLLIAIGLFTRPVAFILSGQMAFAYFMGHAGKSFWPAMNGGDAAILFCFVFLYFVFSGPGAWSVDKR
ncbi:DoxX family protein [Neorhizobium sp. NPDC001467]|uniref:DoxX family protein n=1 Tax=Neorhizobium sp. NPDC001467 TaxID=3390595 RepID=UPI003D086A1C